MSETKKQFFIVVSALFGVFCILLFIFLYLYVSEIQPLAVNFLEKREEIETIEGQTDTYRKIIAPELERNEDFFQEIEDLYFREDRELDFILFIEEIEKRNGIVKSITPPPTAASPRTTITLTGPLSSVIQAIREIENGPFLLRIDSLSVPVSEGGTTRVTMGIVLQTL